MEDVVQKFRGCKYTAFAHCISADTSSEKNMSAGVAVVFKHHFGKPHNSEFLNKYLAYQNTRQEEAGVYSLVTKAKYSHKPTSEDYCKAFKHLMCDFKEKGFKRLICSPMGCIRDRIPVELFASEIVNFQRWTGAIVYIVTHDEQPKRLYGGLPHSDFFYDLNHQIKVHDSLMLKLDLTNLNEIIM
ncbi:hypothetical protein J6590_073761 [Homalodisca vitripennis]|nr:hypothetical protein J6590_073761 [Homalodisca vitripennis]